MSPAIRDKVAHQLAAGRVVRHRLVLLTLSPQQTTARPPLGGFCLIEYILRQRNAVLLSLPTLTL
jgi:hypothetical protein